MNNTEQRVEMPYAVWRAVRRYKEEFRDAITQAVQKKLDASQGNIRPEEIGECAAEIIFAADPSEARRRTRMDAIATQAYLDGRFKTTQEVLDELRSRLAGAAS